MNHSTKICSVDGCEKKYLAKGFCNKHYKRYKIFGDPNIILRASTGEALDFFYKVIKLQTDDCIEWPYSKIRNGYGVVIDKGKKTYVHRLALMLTLGQPPEDKPNALHAPGVCHNPSCFNPSHLRWGDRFDNMADTILDGTDSRGEKHVKAKLTENQVLAIRADKRLHRIIAEQYGIHKSTVSFIKTGRTWKHV